MKKIHPFHFTLDLKTILLLMAAGDLENLNELPVFLTRILKKFYWYIEWFHLEGPSQRCKYRRISDDLTDERKKMWLPLPEELYQRLKSVHKDQNFFSIAQMVRKIIHLYLGMRKKGSHRQVVHFLVGLQREWCCKRDSFTKSPEQSSPNKAPTSNPKHSSVKYKHINRYQEFELENFAPYWVIYNSEAVPEGQFLY